MTEGIEVTLPDGQVFPSIRQASKHVPYSESYFVEELHKVYRSMRQRLCQPRIAGMMYLGLGSLREK